MLQRLWVSNIIMFAFLGACVCIDILGGLIMRKRARNHKIKIAYEELRKEWNTDKDRMWQYLCDDYKGESENYEPQGKRESKKYMRGILYYIPSRF